MRRRSPGRSGTLVALLVGVLVTVLVALIAVVAPAGPAAAHAVLLSTTPADRSQLEAAPAEVTLEFDEPVSTTAGSVRVFDTSGARVDNGDLIVEGSRLRLALRGGLGDGAYVVTYRVISEDAHAITGAFAFTVGAAAAADDATIAGLLTEDEDRTWEIAGAVARGLAYLGALLAAGLTAFLVLAHDGGAEADGLRRWARRSAMAGALGVVLAVPFLAARATGLGIGAVLEPGVARQVLGDNVGWSSAVVLVGLAILTLELGHRRAVSLAGAAAATAGFAIAGHTVSADPRWLVTGADVVHVGAGAVWLGGLVGLAATLRARRRPASTDPTDPTDPTDDLTASAAGVVARFSTVAAASLLVVTAGGLLLAWREVRSVDALTSTTYGKVLVAKVVVVAVVALLGAWNRFRLVPAITSAPKRAARLLQRAVRIESAALLGALALTAVLVNVTPARTAAGIGGIFSATVPLGEGSVNVVVDPNRAGENELHLYVFDDAGRVSGDEFDELTLRLSLPAAEIGPLERQPFVAGPGHWQLDGNDLSIAGEWTVEVVVRLHEFDQVTASVTVPVNP